MNSSIKNILNKLKLINEDFQSAPSLGLYELDKNNNKKYKFKISEALIDIQLGSGTYDINKIEKIKIKWNQFNEKQGNISFTKKEIEILSYEVDIVTQRKFLEFIQSFNKISPKVIKGLIYNLHKLWNEHPFFDDFSQFIIQNLMQTDINNKILNCWKINKEKLFYANSSNILAEEIVNKGSSIEDVLQYYYLDIKNTNFGKEVFNRIILLKLQKIAKENIFTLKDLEYFKNILQSSILNKQESNYVLASLIQLADKSKIQTREVSIDILKDYILNDLDYKDPRNYPEKWLNFDEIAKNIFIKWLSEEDIKIFFDLLIDNDPHGRKEFWLRYAGNVKKSVMILGSSVLQNDVNRKEIHQLQSQGRSFSKLTGNTNAFLLEIGNFVIVEFSETGNACYLYEKEVFEKSIHYYKKYESINELKNKNLVITTFSHHANWTYNLQYWLANKGIRPQ